MKIVGIIPARYGATRLPGKPLAMLAGRPLIEHVWQQAVKARCLSQLLVATDDKRIVKAVQTFGGDAVMTPRTCASGTDRLAWVAKTLKCDVVVNIQGDEPFLPNTYIEKLVSPLQRDRNLLMSTLCAPLSDNEARDPNAVKVVCDRQGRALYFSRAPIPYVRDQAANSCYRLHIGLYAYQREFLLRFARLRQTPLEQAEKLEQLRALENGVAIQVVPVPHPTLSIDTLADLKRARRILTQRG